MEIFIKNDDTVLNDIERRLSNFERDVCRNVGGPMLRGVKIFDYRITPAGTAALMAEIPTPSRKRVA